MFHATPAWLAWLFLFSTQLPFTTASAPLPEDPQCVQLEKLSGWEAAYDYHQHCLGYHIRYFEMKLETLQLLQLGSWYFDQIAQIYKNNPDYLSDNITEAEVFARHMANDGKFECGILNPSCNYHSKPRDIIDRQRVLCPKCKPKELMEESQKVKFALDGIVTINKLHSTVYQMLPVVQTNEGQLSGWIVEHFTHQKNRVSEEFCKFKEKMLAWGIGFVENMACFGWGFMPQPGGTSAANIAMSGFSNFIQSEIQLVQIEIETAVLSAQLDAKDAWENAAQDPTGELMLEIPYTVGLCGSIGGNYEPQNWENQNLMTDYIQDLFRHMREELETSLHRTLAGNWTNGRSESRLAPYLGRPQAFRWYDRLKRGLSAYEGNMTTHFLQVLESAAWTSEKCYLKCIDAPDEERNPEICNPLDWWNAESRYCPPDDEHVTCQLECWTLQDSGNHLKEPPGLQNLKERHGIGQKQVSEASYRKYKEKRSNEYEMSDEMVKQGTVELDVKFGTGTLPYRLPVSMSKYGKLTKFKDTVDVGVHKTLNQQFPCHSGDWKGNETVQFMKQLGYGPDSKDVVSGMASELIETICPYNIRALPPASHFYTLCHLGIQFPFKNTSRMDSYEYNLLLGRNEHCDKLLEEVKDMNEGQGNYHFCFVSDLAAKVMKRELFNSIAPPEEPPWSGMNHRRRCDMFWEKHKKEFKHVKNAMNIEW